MGINRKIKTILRNQQAIFKEILEKREKVLKILNKRSVTVADLTFFVFSMILSIQYWLRTFTLNFKIDGFDDSLRLVSSLYSSNGLVPYKDFSFLYPPGQVIIAELFKTNFQSIYKINALIGLFLSILLVLYFLWKSRSVLFTGILALFLIVSSGIRFASDPYTTPLWLLLLTLIYFYLKQKKKRELILIFLFSVGLFFLRWERSVALTSSVLFILLTLSILKKSGKELIYLGLTLFLSLMTSFLLLVFYLSIVRSDIGKAVYFIFVVPFKILPYRTLPFTVGIDLLLFYICLLGYFALALFIFLKTKRENLTINLFLLAAPISNLMYGLGRKSTSHSIPLLFDLTLICILLSFPKKKFFPLILTIFLFTFSIYLQYFPFSPDTYTSVLDKSVWDCKKLSENVNYNSIFVGMDKYTSYITNYESLYLINPSLKPATDYISDEPGLQNNCQDGAIIAKELATAQKPILTFIDKSHGSENNLTKSMTSCGKIETWLNKNEYLKIGECSAVGNKFEVRVYK